MKYLPLLAIDKDNTINAKEAAAWTKKGILTVTARFVNNIKL